MNKIPIIDENDIQGLIKETERELIKENSFDLKKVKESVKKALAEKGIVEFTEKELNTMPKHIRTLILIEKKRCRIRQHPNKKGYEIRFRRNGYNVSASGVTIELAKENFIEKLKKLKSNKNTSEVPETFNAFTLFYFENFRKEKVGEKTLYNDLNRYTNHVYPYFKEKRIDKITPFDCKKLISNINEKGLGKTADEVFSLLNGIFKMAIAHSLINKNPLDTVFHVKHDKESGKALSLEEEKILFNAINNPTYPLKFRKTLAMALFCGLRTNEYYKIQVKPPFIIAENSKRKNKKIEYKRIPIIKALEPFIQDDLSDIPTEKYLRDFLRKILPDHTLKDLRKTFNTRCKEFGVSDHARKHFMGHSLGALDGTYTELSDEYLLSEAQKLNKWLT